MSGDQWSYYDQGYLDISWFVNSEQSKNWKKGITPIGYGDRKVVTNIGFGGNEDQKHITKYFLKKKVKAT